MCTPWTFTKFVKWRLKECGVSCFPVCRIPLGDEDQQPVDGSYLNSQPIRNVVFDMEGEEVCCKIGGGGEKVFKKGNKKRNKGGKKTSQLNISSPTLVTPTATKKSSISRENGSEEGFIVFCFKEDGAFDVVKDRTKKELVAANSHPDNSTARRVNRKLKFGEDTQAANENMHEERTAENDCGFSSKYEGEEEEQIYSDKDSPFMRMEQYYSEETGNRGLVYTESRDSNQSDGSTGSFAFPVLRWEWMGSPVRMPKSEDLHLRKHRAHIQYYTY